MLSVLVQGLGGSMRATYVDIHTSIVVSAPFHHVWIAHPDKHQLLASGLMNNGSWDYLYEQLFQKVRLGITTCDIPECDWCSKGIA